MAIAKPGSNEEAPSKGSAFEFVSQLAKEVSKGRVELPSFPEVAVRVRNTLADEDVSNEKIARVVGSEVSLAARVFTLANSVVFNRGKKITDLKTAVNRIGHNNVRTTAVAFAIAQLRSATEFSHIAKELKEVWEEATAVAALSYVIAGFCRGINRDEAMLAGLLHNIGKLYLLSRANRKNNPLSNDPAGLTQVIRQWHANVGKAIVDHWGFPERISSAVAEHEHIDREIPQADLTDVLTVSVFMAGFLGKESETDLELNMQGVKAFWRLKLDNEQAVRIMRDSANEIAAMRKALGD
jgi:putative nucleotidyltransferase with HDIG domain